MDAKFELQRNRLMAARQRVDRLKLCLYDAENYKAKLEAEYDKEACARAGHISTPTADGEMRCMYCYVICKEEDIETISRSIDSLASTVHTIKHNDGSKTEIQQAVDRLIQLKSALAKLIARGQSS